jgi:hypothetical protein
LRGRRWLPILLVGVLLAGCTGLLGLPTVTPTPSPPTQPPPEPTGTATDLPFAFVKVYFIALADNGVSGAPVGCGDSAVAVEYPVRFGEDPLTFAFEKVLYPHERIVGESGLYNALYQTDLTVKSAEIKDGKAVVALEGTLTLGGECDNPRVLAQLEMIPGQFAGVTAVEITINGKPLAEALSLK